MKRTLALLLVLIMLLTSLPTAALAAETPEAPETPAQEAAGETAEAPAEEEEEPFVPSRELLSWTAEVAGEIRKNYAAKYSAAELAEAQERMRVRSVSTREVDCYASFLDEPYPVELTFFNGNQAVAYLPVDYLFDFAEFLHREVGLESDYSIDGFYSGKTYTAFRENGSYVLLDFQEGLVYFLDMDLFDVSPYSINGGDLVSIFPWQTDEEGTVLLGEDGAPLVNLLSRLPTEAGFVHRGYSLVEPLAMDHIPVYWHDGRGYLPATTFTDLFMRHYGAFVYDRTYLYFSGVDGFDDILQYPNGKTQQEIAFGSPTRQRTKELAEYAYWELVLTLECNYGLREDHQVGEDFDEWLAVAGLKERLLSLDGVEYTMALSDVVNNYLGDGHSALDYPPPCAGMDYKRPNRDNRNPSNQMSWDIYNRHVDARSKTACVDKEGAVVPYREVGNTAYLTFDEFIYPRQNYYDPEVQADLPGQIGEDTMALIWYANRRINRAKSPIRNVVIDLTCSGGGSVDAGLILVSWLLGTCTFSCVNALSGSQYVDCYQADVDLDGRITDTDHLDLDRLNVYCMVSGFSFSMANIVPALLKQDGRVTILGKQSGGGACVVHPAVTADGAAYQLSSRWRMSTLKNGVFSSVDQGVTPDVVITKLAHYYDRKWLTNYINNLP